jgi:guanylate kinase
MEPNDGKADLIAKISDYTPSEEKLNSVRKLPLVFMVGITSAGKNTVLNRLLQHDPKNFDFIISHTTRAPRINDGVPEVNGKDYYFVDEVEVERMVDVQEFVEVQKVHDKIYGTSIKELQRIASENKIGVTDLDIQGIDKYTEMDLNIRSVFILPPSYAVWMQRLKSRYGDDEQISIEDFRARMQSALQEIEWAMLASDCYIVVNKDLDEAADLVIEIASGETVDPHYHKAVEIAEELMTNIRAELARIG